MSSKTTLRIIQVGLGGWGRNWYQHRLKPEPWVDVVGIVDQSADALALAQKDAGAPADRCYERIEDALASTDAEAVLVTASLAGHVPAASAALAAGKHVLMEKPFAPSVADARALARQARDAERLLMISQNYRYFPAPQRAAELVANGELGRLGVVHLDFRRGNVGYDERRKKHYALANPLLADMAIHHFDLMRMVTATDARRIRCHSFNPPWSSFTDDPAAEAVIDMQNDVVVTYRGSWVSQGPTTAWAGEWRLEFERGEVWFTSRGDMDRDADELWIRRDGGTPRREKLPRMDALDRAGSLREFAACIRGGHEPTTVGEANIGSIALTYAAIEAARTGGWVDVDR